MIELFLVGNLGKDATVADHNGKKVINFSVAHTFKNRDGADQTIWVECASWRDTDNISQYLKKGTKVAVKGSPNVRKWEANGTSGVSLTCMVSQIELCGSAPQPQQQQQQYQQYQQQQPAPQQQPPQQ